MYFPGFLYGTTTPSNDFTDLLTTSKKLVAEVQEIELRRITFVTPSRAIPERIKRFLQQIISIQSRFQQCKETSALRIEKIALPTKEQVTQYTLLQIQCMFLQRRVQDLKNLFENSTYQESLIIYQNNIKKLYESFASFEKFDWMCSAVLSLVKGSFLEPQRRMLLDVVSSLAGQGKIKWLSHAARLEQIQQEVKLLLGNQKLPNSQISNSQHTDIEELIKDFEVITVASPQPLQPHFAFKVEEYCFSTRFSTIYQQASKLQESANEIQDHGIVLDPTLFPKTVEKLGTKRAAILSAPEITTIQMVEVLQYAEALNGYVQSLSHGYKEYENIRSLGTYACRFLDLNTSKEKWIVYFAIKKGLQQNSFPIFEKVIQNAFINAALDCNEYISNLFLQELCSKDPLSNEILEIMLARACRALFIKQEQDLMVDLFISQFSLKIVKRPELREIFECYQRSCKSLLHASLIQSCCSLLNHLPFFSGDNQIANGLLETFSHAQLANNKSEGAPENLLQMMTLCVSQKVMESGFTCIDQEYNQEYRNFYQLLTDSLWGKTVVNRFRLDTKAQSALLDYLPEGVKHLFGLYLIYKLMEGNALVEHEKRVVRELFKAYIQNTKISQAYSLFLDLGKIEMILYKQLTLDTELRDSVKKWRGEQGFVIWQEAMSHIQIHKVTSLHQDIYQGKIEQALKAVGNELYQESISYAYKAHSST